MDHFKIPETPAKSLGSWGNEWLSHMIKFKIVPVQVDFQSKPWARKLDWRRAVAFGKYPEFADFSRPIAF